MDRGKQGIECSCLLLAYKIKYPENFFMLRGNHECASINRIYGFFEECKYTATPTACALRCCTHSCATALAAAPLRRQESCMALRTRVRWR